MHFKIKGIDHFLIKTLHFREWIRLLKVDSLRQMETLINFMFYYERLIISQTDFNKNFTFTKLNMSTRGL